MENGSLAQVSKDQLIAALTAAAIGHTASPGEAVAVLIRVATTIMEERLGLGPAEVYAAFDQWINTAAALAAPTGRA
jgi:hypothetical protein